MGDEATGSGDGAAAAPDGIDVAGVEAWFALHVPSASPPLSFERIAGGPLEPDLPRQRRRRQQLGAATAAARQAPRLRPRHGPRAQGRLRPGADRGPGGAGGRPLRGRGRQRRAPFYVMEFVEGPILRGLAEAEAFPDEGDRRAIGEPRRRHPGRDPRRRPRRGRARRPRPQGGLRRPPAAPLAGPVGEVEDARAAGDRLRPRAPRGPHPRAGPGDDRPRRLPPRQHDPHPDRRGRGRGRLGALHPRRPARRRRPADGLLARPRARPTIALGQPANLAPGFPTREELAARYAERSGRDLADLDFFVALGYWKLAIILEGVYARYAAGGYGKVDDGHPGVRAAGRAPGRGRRRGRAAGRLSPVRPG